MTTTNEGLKTAIEWAGGMRALARLLGLSHTAVQKWERIPAERVVEIETLTGIARERLRPDLYRIPPRQPSHATPKGGTK
jgi:DNA-binding transcriptional regulator YdaS (Cro superfamily)